MAGKAACPGIRCPFRFYLRRCNHLEPHLRLDERSEPVHAKEVQVTALFEIRTCHVSLKRRGKFLLQQTRTRPKKGQ